MWQVEKDQRLAHGLLPAQHRRYVAFLFDLSSSPFVAFINHRLLFIPAICIDECPTVTDYTQFYCQYNLTAEANSNPATGYLYVSQQKCMYQIATKKFLNRCIPDISAGTLSELASVTASQYGYNVSASDIEYSISYGENAGWFTFFLSNLYNLKGHIFGFGMGVTVGAAFFYLTIMRIPYMLLITMWTTILLIFCVLIIGSMLLWQLANTWSEDDLHTHKQIVVMRVFSYAGIIISGLYLCLMIVLRKRINLACGVIKEAARAMESMPTILVVPLIQAIGMCLFLAPWLTYLIFLAASGDMVTKERVVEYNGLSYTSTYEIYEYSSQTKYVFLYMLFTWFWTSEFILAFGQLVIALSFAGWYFTRNKSILETDTVRWAFQEVGLFHLGTAAYGSLIIAVIKTIRAVILYLQKKAKKSKNKVAEYVMCILGCFVWCLEKIMKFINKHAYIITAIYGYSFCRATRKGFFLLLRNILRVAAVNMVSGFVMFLWKFSLPLFVTFLCYLSVAYHTTSSQVSDIVAPLVVTWFISYWVSAMFIDILSMGIETILFCFIADEEMFPPEERFAEGELTEMIHATAKLHAESKGRTYDPTTGTSTGKYESVDQVDAHAHDRDSGAGHVEIVTAQPADGNKI